MELVTAKTNSKRAATGEAEVSKNKSLLNKWLSEVEVRLGDVNPVIKNKQQKAEDNFALVGLPDRKTENFKYTHIRTYLKEDYTAKNGSASLKQEDIEHLLIDDFVSVVMINGKYIPEYSRLKKLPEGVTIKSLLKALEEENELAVKQFNSGLENSTNPLAMLNTALAGDGIFISVPENFSCPVPVHIANICTGENKSFYNPRNLVYLHKNSEFTLIESYHSIKQNEKTFTNSVTEFYIENNSSLENYILQDEDILSQRNDVRQFVVNKNSRMNSVAISLNGGMVRNDPTVFINGENAEVHLNGLYTVKENHLTDNHTMIEHRAPNCFSNELYKGVIADNGTGVFNGKILVYRDAQKTNSYQSNKNILLGDKATINTKPQLEIYADDVRCTHGSSTGKMDEEALFYLRSRGLSEKLAKNILLQAFAKEVSNTIKNESFRTYIERKIEDNIQ
jgi:Fe-S cluster assembly protein SufD